jgi:hypothetical protein
MYLLDFTKKELVKFEVDEMPDDIKQLINKYENSEEVKLTVFFKNGFQNKVKLYFEKKGYIGYYMVASAKCNDKKIPIEALAYLKATFPLTIGNWETKLNSLGVPDFLFFKIENGVYVDAVFVEVKRGKDGVRLDQVQFAFGSPLPVKFAFE